MVNANLSSSDDISDVVFSMADTYAENKDFKYDNTDNRHLLGNANRGPIIIDQHNVTSKATTYPKDFSRKSVKITDKAKVADDYLKAIGHKGGKSNKKRSRKQKLRRRKSLHKKR